MLLSFVFCRQLFFYLSNVSYDLHYFWFRHILLLQVSVSVVVVIQFINRILLPRPLRTCVVHDECVQTFMSAVDFCIYNYSHISPMRWRFAQVSSVTLNDSQIKYLLIFSWSFSGWNSTKLTVYVISSERRVSVCFALFKIATNHSLPNHCPTI